ncbi:phage head closure protein [Gemmobacter nectariphilus]|uniref:phage head closure protein n=1 Tax=Gemmobacter nectariphilus TaxID=220343 RepID=UPI0004204062|nr:phage head closure protein [Gemmobacter nectariphilus]
MIGAGSLRDRITVQRAVEGDDGYGNKVVGWADHLTLWANVRETTGKERVDAGRVEASRTATIRIRASSASREISEKHRLIARGKIWNIRSIAEVGNDRAMLDILCETGVAA